MSRDSSGNYALPNSNPVVTLTTISSGWANATMADLAAELTNSLDRNGRGGMLAAFRAADGTLAAPGMSWAAEPSSGWYRASSFDYRFVMNGSQAGGVTGQGLMQIDDDGNLWRVGFRDIPQHSISANYELTLPDAGKHILHPSADTAARTITVPTYFLTAFPLGTAITIVNQNGAGVLTISITADTMRLAGAGTTGSRTLAANGICTLLKIAPTEWIISGTGLT